VDGRVERAYRRAGMNPVQDPRPKSFVGLDLGQSNDPTAMAILSAAHIENGKNIPERKRKLLCPVLERIPLRTPYPLIVEYVSKVMRDVAKRSSKAHLIVDATGVGRPVVDLFVAAGLKPIAVTITGGHDVTKGDMPGAVNVPKRDLISALQVGMHSGNLKIAREIQFAEMLKRELEMFKIKVSTKGSVSLEAWRESDHDDLVLALALAAWAATYPDLRRFVSEPVTRGTISYRR